MEEQIQFYGHPNITARHRMTIEVTKEKKLTPTGDCVIGVGADKACSDLSGALKRRLKEKSDVAAVVTIAIIVDEKRYEFEARGSPSLLLTHGNDIVIRKSRFVCPRTLAVGSDAASSDLPREIVQMLTEPARKGLLLVSIE